MSFVPVWVKLLAGGIAILSLLALGFTAGSKWTGDQWEARYDAHLFSDQQGVTAALERQKAEALAATQRNKEIEDAHAATATQQALARAASNDRDRIARLLAQASSRARGGGPLPGATDQPAIPAGGTAGGSGSLGRDGERLLAVIEECRANDDTLDGLTQELIPQLAKPGKP